MYPFPQDKEVFRNLSPMYKEVFNATAPFLAKGRWWNVWHTILSVGYMKRILSVDTQSNPDILFPAIILHDSGWDSDTLQNVPEVSQKFPDISLMQTNWNDAVFRHGHMVAGVKIAQTVLQQVGYKNYLEENGDTHPEETMQEIERIISIHDIGWGEGYAEGSPDMSLLGKIHRDADACFIVSGVSFWKDYMMAKKKKGNRMVSLSDYIQQKMEKHGERFTKEGKKIFLEEIDQRKKEIEEINSQEKYIDFWYDYYHARALERNASILEGKFL